VVVGGVAPVAVTLLADGVTGDTAVGPAVAEVAAVICEVSPVAASVETIVVVGGFGSHVQQSLASGSKF